MQYNIILTKAKSNEALSKQRRIEVEKERDNKRRGRDARILDGRGVANVKERRPIAECKSGS